MKNKGIVQISFMKVALRQCSLHLGSYCGVRLRVWASYSLRKKMYKPNCEAAQSAG